MGVQAPPSTKPLFKGDITSDLEKDTSGVSAARGSFWPVQKFGTGNSEEIKSLRKDILGGGEKPNV